MGEARIWEIRCWATAPRPPEKGITLTLRDPRCVSPERGKHWLFFGEGLVDGIAERYRVGEGGVAFRYSGADLGWRAKEHGFIVRALPHELAERWALAPLGNDKALNDRNNRHQPLVLPYSVEVMEGVQEFVPSAVWPQCFDSEAVWLGQPLFTFSAVYSSTGIIEADDSSERRKMGTAVGYYAVATRKAGCQKIKSAADCVDNDSRLDIEAEVGEPCPANYDKIIPRIQIRLYDNCIWARLLPGFESLFHSWDLGFGPIHRGLSV